MSDLSQEKIHGNPLDFSDVDNDARELPLKGMKVIDAATMVAGPLVATFMADFGDEVIKVHHPADRARP